MALYSAARAAPDSASADADPAPRVDYQRQVRPILKEHCESCHGPALRTSGLRLDRRRDALRGGYNGPAIRPHDAAASPLLQRVSASRDGFRMPPTGERLTVKDLNTLRSWIDQGAPWPSAPGVEDLQAAAVDLHWSFRPVERPELPVVRRVKWARNIIDRFVLAKLEQEGVAPSGEADKATLLRRVSLDLTGLPPSPTDADQFLADQSPGAYERLVDRLLDSDHYGEKWARHWLDLARYADSDGYTQDLARPAAWRWRNWVIDALNADMPFDRFTTLQLAADLLDNSSPDDLAATGFHRNTLRNREGGTIYAQSRFEETIDRANTVATTWLGLTVECAQCHDHKYDPITQLDFYSFYAFFDNVQDLHVDAPLPGEMGPYLRHRAEHLAKRQALLEDHGVPHLQPEWERQMKIAADNPGDRTDWDLCYDVLYQMTDGGWEVLYKAPAERTRRESEMLTGYFIDWYQTVVSEERIKELRFKELSQKLKELKAAYPQLSEARIIRERPEPGRTHLRVRGQWNAKAVEVQPRPPEFLPPLRTENRATRLDLAEWIASPENPLTARVAVNRMWQELFGRGLVRTSEDFGTQGDRPSHPELLDWLAAEFVASGWRIKHMHKLIVLSAAYRQSSRSRPELAAKDPDNAWLARQNRLRLPSEILRDSALSVSGLLSPVVGGPSVYPPQPAGVTDITYDWDTVRWKESTGADRYRRGLYTFFLRTSPYPQMMLFDAPDSHRAASRRQRSNTPLQALGLLNDEVFLEAARGLALRSAGRFDQGWQDRLERMYRLALSRFPSEAEAAALRPSYDRLVELFHQSPPEPWYFAAHHSGQRSATEGAAWIGIARILMNTDEFITRE